MKYFSESHEWVEVKGKMATIGITRFAQKELGDIVFVELPKLGSTVRIEQEVAVLESTKAAADVYCPLSGIVKEVNSSLLEEPEKINNSPEIDGWILKLELTDEKELSNLMDEATYLRKVGHG